MTEFTQPQLIALERLVEDAISDQDDFFGGLFLDTLLYAVQVLMIYPTEPSEPSATEPPVEPFTEPSMTVPWDWAIKPIIDMRLPNGGTQ